jgi:hypothetical protein
MKQPVNARVKSKASTQTINIPKLLCSSNASNEPVKGQSMWDKAKHFGSVVGTKTKATAAVISAATKNKLASDEMSELKTAAGGLWTSVKTVTTAVGGVVKPHGKSDAS